MKYKWASIDLDHTLLNSLGRIDNSSYSSIKEYQALGGKMFICTGRWLISAMEFNKQIEEYTKNKNDFLISLNGALIYDLNKNENIYKNFIPDDKIKRIFEIRKDVNISLWMYSMRSIIEKKIFVIKLPLKKLVQKFNYGQIVKLDLDKYKFNEDTLKILFLSFRIKKIDLAFKRLEDEFTNELTFSRTSKRSIEITNKNCNKGEAIKFIREKYNIEKDSIVGFGDSNNDISMFQEVGLKMSINPSSEKLIEISDHIFTGRNPFSRAMKELLLIK